MKKIRTWIRLIHLWLGLASGLIVLVVCLTGTLLAFEEDISALFRPQVQAGSAHLPLEQLIARIEANSQKHVLSIDVAMDPDQPWAARLGADQDPPKPRPQRIWIEPYSGEILPESENSIGKSFFGTCMRLHRWLLLDREIGRPIVGIATLIFSFLCLSGLILWVPKKVRSSQQWLSALLLRKRKTWKRTNYDLHNVLGFYALGFLLVMGLTGPFWSFNWYRETAKSSLGIEMGFGRRTEPVSVELRPDLIPISFNNALNLTDQTFSYPADRYQIDLPQSENQALIVKKFPRGFWAREIPDWIQLDPKTGEILKIQAFSSLTFSQKIGAQIRGLHTGSFGGTGTKILFFLACLIGTSLPVTGTLIWWNRLKRKPIPIPAQHVSRPNQVQPLDHHPT